jgi:hypothetical protein
MPYYLKMIRSFLGDPCAKFKFVAGVNYRADNNAEEDITSWRRQVKDAEPGATITIIRTDTGVLIGGYKSTSWGSIAHAGQVMDKNAFIFSLSLG